MKPIQVLVGWSRFYLNCIMLVGASLAVSLYTENSVCAQEPPEPKWRPEKIDDIQIGYGLQLVDINGDGQRDILLADKKTIQWYAGPDWAKHVIARDLTQRDNVCVTARDLDGDGKAEIAVGGQWNFRETTKDGAVFYLQATDEGREKPWQSIELHHEPSVHRMHWVETRMGQFQLFVKPLRGRGSQDGEGPGLKLLRYFRPVDATQEWRTTAVCDFLHLSHNFHVVNWDADPEEEIIVAAKEGVWHFDGSTTSDEEPWRATQLTDAWAGEVRDGQLPNGRRFIVTVQPMHGSACAVYAEPPESSEKWSELAVLDDALKDGHALACADFLGTGSDQIVVGWRAMNAAGVPGVKLFTPLDAEGQTWRESVVSTGEVAVEDIKVADMNGDGKVDIVVAARQTKNLVVFFNETAE